MPFRCFFAWVFSLGFPVKNKQKGTKSGQVLERMLCDCMPMPFSVARSVGVFTFEWKCFMFFWASPSVFFSGTLLWRSQSEHLIQESINSIEKHEKYDFVIWTLAWCKVVNRTCTSAVNGAIHTVGEHCKKCLIWSSSCRSLVVLVPFNLQAQEHKQPREEEKEHHVTRIEDNKQTSFKHQGSKKEHSRVRYFGNFDFTRFDGFLASSFRLASRIQYS